MNPYWNVLVSLYYKEPYLPLLKVLSEKNVHFYSTGGTASFLRQYSQYVFDIELLTGYPSILGGRVKTLHPKVFGGILARADNPQDQNELKQFDIPCFDIVIVDLYPFQETVAHTQQAKEIIEKIDIGGVSLIRAAAKNFERTIIIADPKDAALLSQLIQKGESITYEVRKKLAKKAFAITSAYDNAIFNWFADTDLEISVPISTVYPNFLRYGENPHQKAVFYGKIEDNFTQLNGKELSYNNLLDIAHAIQLIDEFQENEATCAIIKHNNPCGIATRANIELAWQSALSCDPLSAFGGVVVCNKQINKETASQMDKVFFEILIAPDFEPQALHILSAKKNRILLQRKLFSYSRVEYRSVLNGLLVQQKDLQLYQDFRVVSVRDLPEYLKNDVVFGLKAVKHLKSNAIAIVKNEQLIGSGTGQTSRIDALKQAIHKLKVMGFDTKDAVLVSDAFFPFSDNVEMAHQAGIEYFVQPGGSMRDQESIDYCNKNNLCMIFTNMRHFKH
ncbi:MAG: bifunctional phosphoribosylaminoimidazolecarboxamide formyltransferase/IMP cyclohydrolase [Bacteroidia bacterium]|nr:bifunctional phosphoribosylaminoimidazolecarboxamide formyltransferase/IMP cyclohydrolase [Bacteroidia bacterium]MDW8345692.1 bifunctional phosphoribosylaminoimidazolecarboxamide formyltransferase/IMP cyclohydrolase [Bacteroidia bacterium]